MKVSVIIPCFNAEQYLRCCLDSVIHQSYTELEILISDDFSSDNSKEIIKEFAAKDARVVAFYQSRNLGLIGNYNFLLAKCSGDLIAIQDADDWAELSRIANQVAIFKASPQYDLVGTSGTFHYKNGVGFGHNCKSKAIDGINDDFPSIPASIMFKRKLYEQKAGYNLFFDGGTSMDRYFIMEMLEGKLGYHLDENLYHARVSSFSHSRQLNTQKIFTEALFIELLRQRKETGFDWLKNREFNKIQLFKHKVLSNRSLLSEANRVRSVLLIDDERYQQSFVYLKEAIKLQPFRMFNYRTLIYYYKKRLKLLHSNNTW